MVNSLISWDLLLKELLGPLLSIRKEKISASCYKLTVIFGDYECFLSGAKSNWQLQTTTRTEVVLIEKQHLHFLMQRDPFWIGFYKQVADICFLEAKRRIEELLFYTYEQRYLNLLTNRPKVIEKYHKNI